MTMPEKRIFAKAGHICMICGFRARTKNKYRELQDHLVRQHFQDRIKAALPTRRPFMCPDKSCTVEGKDWQALMRHYTGKHGILEAYLKEVLASGILNNKENYVHRGHPSKLQQNRVSKIGFGSRTRRKRPSTTSSVSSSLSSTGGGGGEGDMAVTTILPEPDHEDEDLETEMIDSQHLISSEEDPANMCNGMAIDNADETSYHTLEVDDTELAEYPTHLALVLKRPKVGKNGMVEPDSLEETYAFVDLKYFMPISANKYIMKSHVNLDEPGVAFTLPHFPMNTAFMGESDPSLPYCATSSSSSVISSSVNSYYESIPTHHETVLLTSADADCRTMNNSNNMVMTNQGLIHSSHLQYPTPPTTCGQTIIQSYSIPSPQQQQQQQQLQHHTYPQMGFMCDGSTVTNYCGGPSSTSSSPPITVNNCCHDQVVPSVSTADSPSPPAIQEHQHQMQEQLQDQQQQQPRLVLPCPMGCVEHSMQSQQQHLHQHLQQQQQQPMLPVQLRSSPPTNVQLQIRPCNNSNNLGKICTTTTATSGENIISVSSTSATTKVIVEAAKSIPIEGQADLQHMQQHHQHSASLQEIKELDFSMF